MNPVKRRAAEVGDWRRRGRQRRDRSAGMDRRGEGGKG